MSLAFGVYWFNDNTTPVLHGLRTANMLSPQHLSYPLTDSQPDAKKLAAINDRKF